MNVAKNLIPILILFTIISCKKTSGPTPPSNQPIDSNIYITMDEQYDSISGRLLVFHCATAKQYPCSNYLIDYTLSSGTNSSKMIAFDSVTSPNICLTSIGPAMAKIYLGQLANGTYPLTFVNGDSSEGTLTVTDDRYVISMQTTHNISIVYDTLMRLPPDTWWGNIGYVDSVMMPIVQSFIDSFQYIGAQNVAFAPGYYGYFMLQPNNNFGSGTDGYPYERKFIYKYNGSSSSLSQLVQNYGYRYGDSLYISVYNGEGDKFLSWMH